MSVEPDRGVCRSCDAAVWWALTAKGERTPIDVNARPDGNTLLLRPAVLGGSTLMVVLSGDALARARSHGELYISHWATCPDRQEWRERTDAKREEAASAVG